MAEMPESDNESTALRLLESDQALALLKEISNSLKVQNDRLARLEAREEEKIGAHRGETAGMSEAQAATILQKEAAAQKDRNRPTYMKVDSKYLSSETLDDFGIEWELDSDPNYLLIKRWIPEDKLEDLWNHTRMLRREPSVARPEKTVISYPSDSEASATVISPDLPRFLQAPYDHRLWLGFLGNKNPPSPSTKSLQETRKLWFSKKLPGYNSLPELQNFLDGALRKPGTQFLIRDSDSHGNNRLYSRDGITEYRDERDPYDTSGMIGDGRRTKSTSSIEVPPVTWHFKGEELLVVDWLPFPAPAPWRRTVLLEGLESTRPPVCDDTSTSDEGLESTRPPVYSDTSASDESRSVNLLFLFDQDKVILKHLQGGSYYRWPPGRPMVTFQFSWYKIVNAKVEHNPSSTSLHSHLRWDAGPLYNQYQSTLQEQVFTIQAIYRSDWDASPLRTDLADEQYWTMLIITPPDFYGKNKRAGPTALNDKLRDLPQTLLQRAMDVVRVMTKDWNELLDHVERLLFKSKSIFNPSVHDDLLLDDDSFIQSRSLWWIVDAIDMFHKSINDCAQQYESFRDIIIKPEERLRQISEELIKANHLSKEFFRKGLRDEDIEETLISQVPIRKKLIDEKNFIEVSELVFKNFLNITKRIDGLKLRAVELRNGLFSASSAADARSSTRLGENVKLLTYVTIFYLPLAFCTSMWAINDMFGTGTHGFAIITTIIAVVTYAVVFWLLHPNVFGGGFEALCKCFSRRKDPGSDDKGAGIKRSPTGKGKEKEQDADRDKGLQTTQTVMDVQAPKSTLISRWRRGKSRAQGDEEASP